MAFPLAFVFLAFSASLFAVRGPAPSIPTPGEDTILTGGLTAREFFEKRASDAACVDDLKKEKAAEGAILTKIADLKKSRAGKTGTDLDAINDQIDALEPDLTKARNTMLDRMEMCGECATRPLDPVESDVILPNGRKDPTKTQKWYVSNGSCQIPTKDPKILKEIFNTVSQSLIETEKYPKTAEGGFANILNFKVANNKDLTPTADNVFPAATPEKPINVYLWVLGPKLGAQFIFYYYLKSFHETKTNAAGLSEFRMDFETTGDPRLKGSWKVPGAPDVSDSALSGRVRGDLTIRMPLNSVKGQWYVNSDGYIRYFTAAEFPVKMDDIEKLGRRILIRTLYDASKRAKLETTP